MMKKLLLLAPVTLATPLAVAKPPPQKVVTVVVNQNGFHPSHVKAKLHQRLIIKFKRTSDKGCATSVVFPELSIKKALPLNETVSVTIPTRKGHTFAFQCGMGMYKSSVVVR